VTRVMDLLELERETVLQIERRFSALDILRPFLERLEREVLS
jgi:hypothetical protein